MKLPELIYRRIFEFFLFVILEIIAVVLLMHNGALQSSRIMGGVRGISAVFWKNANSVKSYTNLRRENEYLQEENKLLVQQNNLYKEFIIREKGEDKLEEISSIISKNSGEETEETYEFILAKVVKNTRGSLHNYLIIDKGSNDGIIEDLGVITPTGVVGIVRGVGSKYSYVLSFLNLKQSISAKIGNSEAYGSLKWDGEHYDKARLTQIPLNVEVNPGDIVYTSGNSSFFPSDIPIGVAGEFNVASGISKDVEVPLFQDYRNLDYVIIVKNNARAQIDSLSNITPFQNQR